MIVEAGLGWVPYWLNRMDHHQEEWGHASLKLPMKASDYFKRQCFVAADAYESLLTFTVDTIGNDNICFSTDYPHPDHEFKGCVANIAEHNGLSDESKRKILGENAARFFGI
jgi:predicted TIM-barrel fold metal-dependent hydrolase